MYRTAKIFVLIFGGLVGAYLALLLILPFTKFSLGEMDWNGDGHATLSEVLRGDDIGRRRPVDGPAGCIEYFDLKTGLPVKVTRPAHR
jgi:hypothetical protein